MHSRSETACHLENSLEISGPQPSLTGRGHGQFSLRDNEKPLKLDRIIYAESGRPNFTNRAQMKCLIFKVNQLGDTIVFLPAFQELRRRFPSWSFYVFCTPVSEPLFEEIPRANVHVFSNEYFRRAWRHSYRFFDLLKLVRSIRADICLYSEDQGPVSFLLGCLARIPMRVGPSHRRLSWTLTHPVTVKTSELVGVKDWRIAQKLAQSMGDNHTWVSAPPAPELFGLPLSRCENNKILIHPGASREYKKWSLERFLELANLLSKDFEVVWIEQRKSEEAKLLNGIKKLRGESLFRLTQEIQTCSLYIGNNSGPMHLASALGVPCIIFNGPSDPPWDPHWNSDLNVLLRDPSVLCQPCDSQARPANICRNQSQPMQCMNVWTLERAYSIVVDSFRNRRNPTKKSLLPS